MKLRSFKTWGDVKPLKATYVKTGPTSGRPIVNLKIRLPRRSPK